MVDLPMMGGAGIQQDENYFPPAPRGGLGGLGGFLARPGVNDALQASFMSMMSSPRNNMLQNMPTIYAGIQQGRRVDEKDARAQAQADQERQALKAALIAGGVPEGEADMLSANPAAAKMRLSQVATETANQQTQGFLSNLGFGGGDYGVPANAPRIAEPSDDSWTALGQQYGWTQPGAQPDTEIAQAQPQGEPAPGIPQQSSAAEASMTFVSPEMRDLLEKERRYSLALLAAPTEAARKAVEGQLDYTRKQIERMKPTDTQKNLEWRARAAGLVPGTKEFRDFIMTGGRNDGVTVNVGGDGAPGLGKLSADYGYVLDPETRQPVIDAATGLPQAAPVPGSPAARAAEEAERMRVEQNVQRNRYADVVLQDVGRALDMVGADTAGLGSLLQAVPGSSARNLDALLTTIKANVGFDRLQAMREASPTGGALGAVSDFENRQLQSTLGNLEQSQTPEQLKYNLQRFRDTYLDIIHGPGNRPDAGDEGAGASQSLPEGVTDDDVEHTMRVHGLSREEVLRRLAEQ